MEMQRLSSAFDAYIRQVVRFAGAYIAVMNGVDAIALQQVGENTKLVRAAVMEHLGYMGVKINHEANDSRGEEVMISDKDSKVKVFVVPTNEELAIARETVEIVNK